MADDEYSAGGVMEKGQPRLDKVGTSPNRHDEEKKEIGGQSTRYKSREDPFGDESNSEVKYKVMAWWWVPFPSQG